MAPGKAKVNVSVGREGKIIASDYLNIRESQVAGSRSPGQGKRKRDGTMAKFRGTVVYKSQFLPSAIIFTPHLLPIHTLHSCTYISGSVEVIRSLSECRSALTFFTLDLISLAY